MKKKSKEMVKIERLVRNIRAEKEVLTHPFSALSYIFEELILVWSTAMGKPHGEMGYGNSSLCLKEQERKKKTICSIVV